MKKIAAILIFLVLSCANKNEISQVVEASCGQCKFGMTNQQGCDLAIKIDGKAYFVDGTKIDDHGDAHNKQNGFCEVIRKAKVTGKIINDRFIATTFKMIKK